MLTAFLHSMDESHIERLQIKRIRQACRNCRRKKARCSGTKPECDFCRRLSQTCSYSEPESDDGGSGTKRKRSKDSESVEGRLENDLTEKVLDMDARLTEMSNDIKSLTSLIATRMQPSTTPVFSPLSNKESILAAEKNQNISRNPLLRGHLPSKETITSALDVYFQYCHNQPYSLLHEETLRSRLALGQVPHHLVFAILASAARFTADLYSGHKKHAIDLYAMESWRALVVPWNGIEDRVGISIVQTILLLAHIDYTEGKAQGAWIKVGLAIRIIQDFGLMKEPDSSLTSPEQEERRRIFWSFYLCDKLMSCGREKPLAIPDEICKVHLPCDEDSFGSDSPMSVTITLDGINADLASVDLGSLSPFSMTVLMASVLGRSTQYALGGSGSSPSTGAHAPWNPLSSFSAIHHILLQIESDFGINKPLSEIINTHEYIMKNGSINQHKAAPLVFSRALFHLCHCLLRHPILFRHKLGEYAARAPLSFISQALDDCRAHARSLCMLVQEIKHMACPILSALHDPFYGYCVMVAGTIHSLFLHSNSPGVSYDAQNCFDLCLQSLEEQSFFWTSSGHMVTRLKTFYDSSIQFSTYLDPHCKSDTLPTGDMAEVLECLDYSRLAMPPEQTPNRSFNVSNIPSPVFDDFLSLLPLDLARNLPTPLPEGLATLPDDFSSSNASGKGPAESYPLLFTNPDFAKLEILQ